MTRAKLLAAIGIVLRVLYTFASILYAICFLCLVYYMTTGQWSIGACMGALAILIRLELNSAR